MPEEVDLETYCEEIDSLIRRGRSDEAIAAARHILSFYPKFIEAYRLLGKAYLEKGELANAADMFLRVLGADPEDFIAYVGLVDVYRTEDKIEQAIWFLERAIDLEPARKELRKELETLYRALGVTELIPHYTLAGLARTYFRSGLLEQAAQALNEALEREPDRIDLRMTLAEVLWRMGRRLEAAQTCLEVLDVLPYCLKANLILGYIWSSINPGEARAKFELAQALDPLNRKAWELFGRDSPLQPRQIKVPRFEFIITPIERKIPAWAEALETEEEPPLQLEKPEEIEELLVGPEVEMAPEEIPSRFEGEAAPAGVELPPWLEEEISEEVPLEELPPWLREEVPPPVRLEEEALAPEKPSLEEVPSEEAPALFWPEGEAEFPEELPPWLREEITPEEVPPPSWLKEEVPLKETPAEIPPWFEEEAFPEEAPLPSWLEEVPSEEVPEPLWPEVEKAPPEEVLAPAEAEKEEFPVLPAVEEVPPGLEKEEIPPSWIESLKPLAESFLEGEVEMALAAEAETAVEELPLVEEIKVERPPVVKPMGVEELLETARARAREGDWEEALRYYRKLFRHKKYREEISRELEKALERGVKIPALFELLGDIYREKGQLDRALELYRKALLRS
ncbi:MAG: tetratricopeptide repeat protein [Anaerolineae bacterium]|nr:tetratricopeptide repeat protein [Anaerolineae bacterium]MDW8101946.1 tetratricopeptide repeat protein [Anaerolineae bacterium]